MQNAAFSTVKKYKFGIMGNSQCPQGGSGRSNTATDFNGGLQDLHMAENLIYYSREDGKDTKQSHIISRSQGNGPVQIAWHDLNLS